MHDRIRAIREGQGISIRKFGEIIGISGSAVSSIENCRTNASEQTIRAICSSFNVNRHWLETGEGEPYVAIPTSADLISRIAAENNYGPGGEMLLRVAVRIFNELGPEALERIVEETIPAIRSQMYPDPADRAEPLEDPSLNEKSV